MSIGTLPAYPSACVPATKTSPLELPSTARGLALVLAAAALTFKRALRRGANAAPWTFLLTKHLLTGRTGCRYGCRGHTEPDGTALGPEREERLQACMLGLCVIGQSRAKGEDEVGDRGLELALLKCRYLVLLAGSF